MKNLIFQRFVAVCLTLFILFMQISGTEVFAKESGSEVGTTTDNTYDEADSSQESSSEESTLESGSSQEEVSQTFCEGLLYQSLGAELDVVQIGDKKYTSWEKACEEVPENGTIILLKDVTSYNTMPTGACTIDGGNSNSLHFDGTPSLNTDITFKDLTITSTQINCCGYNVTILGTVSADHTNFKDCKLLSVSNTGSLSIVEVNCEELSVEGLLAALTGSIAKQKAVINGTLKGPLSCGDLSGTGTIICTGAGSLCFTGEINETASLTLNADESYVPAAGDVFAKHLSGTEAITNIDKLILGDGFRDFFLNGKESSGSYIYTLENAAVQVTNGSASTVCKSWWEAIVEVKPGGTMKLLTDVTMVNLELPSTACTIDGAGHTLTVTDGKTQEINADITLKDLTIVSPKKQLNCSNYNITILGTVHGENLLIFMGGQLNINSNSSLVIDGIRGTNLINLDGYLTTPVGISCYQMVLNGTLTTETTLTINEQLSGTGIIIFPKPHEYAHLHFRNGAVIDSDTSITLKAGYNPIGRLLAQVTLSNAPIANIDKLILGDGFSNDALKRSLYKGEYIFTPVAAVSSVELGVPEDSVECGTDVTVTAKLKDSDGKALDYDGAVSFYMDGSLIGSAVTVHTDGVYTVKLEKPVAGTHTITAKYFDDSFVPVQLVTSKQKTLTVTKKIGLSALKMEDYIHWNFVLIGSEGLETEYTFYLPHFLKAKSNYYHLDFTDAGKVSYSDAVIQQDTKGIIKKINISGDLLTVCVNNIEGNANFTVIVTADNYSDYGFLYLSLSNMTGSEKSISPSSEIAVGSLTYGEPLSDCSLSGTFQCEGKNIEGNICWDAPNTIPSAGTYMAHYTFCPDNLYYMNYRGEAAVTVNKRPLSLSTVSIADKTYDGMTAAGVTDVTFNNAVSGDTINYTTSSHYASGNVGIYNVPVTVTLTGASTKNYNLTNNKITKEGRITKAVTTVAAQDDIEILENCSKAYTFNLDSIALEDVTGNKSAGMCSYCIGAPQGTLSFSSAPVISDNTLSFTTDSSNKEGNFATIPLTIQSKNYEDISVILTIKAVKKISLTISGISMINKTYDGKRIQMSGTPVLKNGSVAVSGGSLAYTFSGVDDTLYNSSVVPPKDAGSYQLKVCIPSNAEYEGSTTIPFMIKKAPLTVKPKDKFCYVENKLPPGEVEYIGLVNGETKAALQFNNFFAANTITDTKAAGRYEIALIGSAFSANYEITNKKGTLMIRKIIDSASKITPNGLASPDKPSITVPNSSGLEHIVLLVDLLTEAEKTAIVGIVSSSLPNIPQSQIVEYDISLINTANNNEVYEPDKAATVTIPYPSGTDSSYTFTILHLINGTTPEILAGKNTENGIQFTVSSFSPFIIGYTKQSPSSNEDFFDDSDRAVEKIRKKVKDNIKEVNTGDKIKANFSAFTDSIVEAENEPTDSEAQNVVPQQPNAPEVGKSENTSDGNMQLTDKNGFDANYAVLFTITVMFAGGLALWRKKIVKK